MAVKKISIALDDSVAEDVAAELSRFLEGCQIELLDETSARAAGRVRGLAGTSDVIDAAVVVGAVTRGDLVVTSDRGDIERVTHALGASIEIVAV